MDEDKQREVLAYVASKGVIKIFDRLCDVADLATHLAEFAPEDFLDAEGLRDVILKAEATAEAAIRSIKPGEGETEDDRDAAIESFKRAIAVRLVAVNSVIDSREK